MSLNFSSSFAGEEVHELVEVFCDNIDSSVPLPDIGTWVAVRVTAVFNPGHFWVQFPYGSEPIEKRIMTGMLSPTNEGPSDRVSVLWTFSFLHSSEEKVDICRKRIASGNKSVTFNSLKRIYLSKDLENVLFYTFEISCHLQLMDKLLSG